MVDGGQAGSNYQGAGRSKPSGMMARCGGIAPRVVVLRGQVAAHPDRGTPSESSATLGGPSGWRWRGALTTRRVG